MFVDNATRECGLKAIRYGVHKDDELTWDYAGVQFVASLVDIDGELGYEVDFAGQEFLCVYDLSLDIVVNSEPHVVGIDYDKVAIMLAATTFWDEYAEETILRRYTKD